MVRVDKVRVLFLFFLLLLELFLSLVFLQGSSLVARESGGWSGIALVSGFLLLLLDLFFMFFI